MILSIATFSEFLLSAAPTFKTLRGVTVVKQDNYPLISCSSQFAEAQVTISGKQYMLCVPLKGEIETSLERLCLSLNKISNGALTEYRILKGEITLTDSLGRHACYDIILQAMPEGERLDRAVALVATSRLRAALELLKREMKKLGFVHGNLKPANLIYGEDGRLYPIRYNYARLGASESDVDSDMRSVEEFMAGVVEIPEIGEFTTPAEYENPLPYDEVYMLKDMMRRVCKNRLYGYLDHHNNEVIEPQYIYAEDFFEDRAVVQTSEGKMGAIDHNNRWVVEPIYDMLGFENGVFEARIGDKWIDLDYSGKIINHRQIVSDVWKKYNA